MERENKFHFIPAMLVVWQYQLDYTNCIWCCLVSSLSFNSYLHFSVPKEQFSDRPCLVCRTCHDTVKTMTRNDIAANLYHNVTKIGTTVLPLIPLFHLLLGCPADMSPVMWRKKNTFRIIVRHKKHTIPVLFYSLQRQ
jgi:hypothetical protein